MGDFEYMRNLMNLAPGEEPDMVEIFLEREERAQRLEEEQLRLEAGRVVHLIWLTQDLPASFVGAAFNFVLPEDVVFANYNHLKDPTADSPGSWFVANGLSVRSRKVGAYWLQCVFGSERPADLFRHEIVEYLQAVAKMQILESELPEGFVAISAENGVEGTDPAMVPRI